MGRRMRSFSLGLVVLAFGLHAPVARAGEEESRSFFARGRELRLQGKCTDAIVQFRKALENYPDGLGSLRNIAECEEQLSHFASARRAYWDLRVAAMKSNDPKYQGWDKDASSAYERLAPLVPRVVIRLRDAPPGSKARLNGRPLDASSLDTDLEQDVGDLEVVLEDGSAQPPSRVLRLEQGQRYEVVLTSTAHAAPLEKGPVKGPVSGPVTPPPGGTSPLVIAGGLTLGGAGLSLIGLFAAVGVRQSALGEVEDGCGVALTRCDPSLKEAVDRGQTASTLVNVFAVGAGALGALGAGLTLGGALGGETHPEPAVAWGVAPRPGGAAFVMEGSF